MDKFNNLKSIWNQQEITRIDYYQFQKHARDYYRKEKRRNIIANIILLATSIIILFIWWYYQPNYITTKVGIIIVILTMLIYLTFLNKTNRFIKQPAEEVCSRDYLKNLLDFRNKQEILQHKGMNAYLLLIFMGVALYMFEYVGRMEMKFQFLSYAIVIFWFFLNWFYFKPQVIRKQKAQLNTLIKQLQELNQQFKD